jgi:hypothetical protein
MAGFLRTTGSMLATIVLLFTGVSVAYKFNGGLHNNVLMREGISGRNRLERSITTTSCGHNPASQECILPAMTRSPKSRLAAAVGHHEQLHPQSLYIPPLFRNSTPLISDPKLVRGVLDNGLEYYVLPHAVPNGRFEAHLAVLSGSIHEFDNQVCCCCSSIVIVLCLCIDQQQGMAHLTEHVSYMGSSKRHLLAGTGSRTNAYTDFHTTVFFAACPNKISSDIVRSGNSLASRATKDMDMFPLALDALVDVMEAQVTLDRLEMERKAVLSEASMINKIEYRSECVILGNIHKENRLSKRFPIGKEAQIKAWTRQDVQFFHDLHYRPDNAVLYVVGDIATGGSHANRQPADGSDHYETEPQPLTLETVEGSIKQKFGGLKSRIPNYKDVLNKLGNYPRHLYHSNNLRAEKDELKSVSMQQLSRHYPPLTHKWSVPQRDLQLVEDTFSAQVKHNAVLIETAAATDGQPITEQSQQEPIYTVPTVFQSPLLQSFTFHISSKHPITPANAHKQLAYELIRKMVVSAMSVRLSIASEKRHLFYAIDFNEMNWAREGCAVGSLDFSCDLNDWREAVEAAILEARRMSVYGLTQGEFVRFRHSLKTDLEQMVAQADNVEAEVRM